MDQNLHIHRENVRMRAKRRVKPRRLSSVIEEDEEIGQQKQFRRVRSQPRLVLHSISAKREYFSGDHTTHVGVIFVESHR